MKSFNNMDLNSESDQKDKLKEMLRNTFLEGKRVFIRNFIADDYEAFAGLFADEDVLYYFLPGQVRTYSASDLKNLLADWNDFDTAFVYTILHKNDPVGLITCESVDFDMGHTEVGIALLNTAVQGKGLATEAMTVFIDFLFEDLGLHRINARIISGNETSLKLFQRLGFRQEGRQREYVRRGSSYLDMNLYGLLAQDWQEIGKD
ncbi:MAG: GNAT family protein [Eubacteriales bacterium]|nr:GNAT family protein [Eubacteriales bacterium]